MKETNIGYNRNFQMLFYDAVVPNDMKKKKNVILIQGDGAKKKLIVVANFADDRQTTVGVFFLRQEGDKTKEEVKTR